MGVNTFLLLSLAFASQFMLALADNDTVCMYEGQRFRLDRQGQLPLKTHYNCYTEIECKEKCDAQSTCIIWQWQPTRRICWIMDVVPYPDRNSDFGINNCDKGNPTDKCCPNTMFLEKHYCEGCYETWDAEQFLQKNIKSNVLSNYIVIAEPKDDTKAEWKRNEETGECAVKKKLYIFECEMVKVDNNNRFNCVKHNKFVSDNDEYEECEIKHVKDDLESIFCHINEEKVKIFKTDCPNELYKKNHWCQNCPKGDALAVKNFALRSGFTTGETIIIQSGIVDVSKWKSKMVDDKYVCEAMHPANVYKCKYYETFLWCELMQEFTEKEKLCVFKHRKAGDGKLLSILCKLKENVNEGFHIYPPQTTTITATNTGTSNQAILGEVCEPNINFKKKHWCSDCNFENAKASFFANSRDDTNLNTVIYASEPLKWNKDKTGDYCIGRGKIYLFHCPINDDGKTFNCRKDKYFDSASYRNCVVETKWKDGSGHLRKITCGGQLVLNLP